MSRILVSGLVNIETNVKIDSFPIHYQAIHYPFFGVNSYPSGVAFNIASALSKLGDEINLLSITGGDSFADVIKEALMQQNISSAYITANAAQTAQSLVLYDATGTRAIYCDLKDIQECMYDSELFYQAAQGCDILCICNIHFSRFFLPLAKKMGKCIATDVHVLGDIYDSYNADFMKYANILFLSHEHIHEDIELFVKKLATVYNNDIIIVGMGSEGAMLYVAHDSFIGKFHAIVNQHTVNTVGAGDALFSAFVHYYAKTYNPYTALSHAILFASCKTQETGASNGFINESQLEEKYRIMTEQKTINHPHLQIR